VTFRHHHALLKLFGILVLWIIATGYLTVNTFAAPPNQANPTPQPTDPAGLLSIGNDVCLGCHGQPGLTMPLENGDILDLYVNPDDYNLSIHGNQGYACVQCHTQVGNYPHPTFSAVDLRDVTVKLNDSCQRCHSHQYLLAKDSVHATAFTNGNREAAVCVDCHTAHTVRQLTNPQTYQLLPEAHVWISQTCGRCHSEIYNKYQVSVHGQALLGEGNPDVPTCIDCHGVHNIENPTTTTFRLKSPQMCSRCHTDPKVVGKYGLSTNVLNTYVADFHGTTVAIFEKQTPDAATNKAVCYDCHGVHDIQRVKDPNTGIKLRENLLIRCRICHPGANANFPDAWLSHYLPSPEHYPWVYYVNQFYRFFIPVTLGGMALLVVMDVGRTTRNRYLELIKNRPKKKPITPILEEEKKPEPGETANETLEANHG
jgi:hypothetical protein